MSLSHDDLITLSGKQINEFIQNGVLIVPNVLKQNEIADALNSLHKSLLRYDIDVNNLLETGQNLTKLSTTGGAGGIIDLFYEPFRLNLATHPQIFNITKQIWSNTYGQYSNNNSNNRIIRMIDKLIDFIDADLFSHPFGSFDSNSGYIYMNRVCFRVSDSISNRHSKGMKKKRKLQRCLAPHLDCCPCDLFGLNRDKLGIKAMRRWRPIQLIVTLTDNHCKNSGGFECVKGFHHKFNEYFAKKRDQTICVGDFCRLLPQQDKDILSNFEHIRYDSGSLILFDWRIPHANSRYNVTDKTRIVVYSGLLPNIELNRKYCKEQLKCYEKKCVPPDFWGNENYSNQNNILQTQIDDNYQFSLLGQKLMGIQPW